MKTYKKLTPIEHILKRPGMYIGSIDKVIEYMDILEDDKIINKEIEYSSGLYKIFDEIISNAYDEAIRSSKVQNIKVNIENNKISIYNDGSSIDIVKHKEYKVYNPELIFGQLLTSSTFSQEKRITAGTHGLGAKLTNIFSKKFIVEIGDSKNKKHYKQVFENNMKKINKPEIKPYTKNNFVKITFIPDYKKFGFDNLTEDNFKLFKRRTYDLAGIIKNVNVYFNKEKIIINNFVDYIKLYYKDNDINFVYQKCGDSEFVISNSKDDKFKQISFVNSVYTKYGGKHVDFIMKQFLSNMNKAIAKKYKKIKIRDSFIKDKIWIFINAVIENPVFSSQSKDSLSSNVKDDYCIIKGITMKNVISKLDLTSEIISLIKAKETLQLEKTNTKRKKSKIKDIPKLYDANYAGTKKSIQCSLILTEGDSAKTMAISGLSAIHKGNDIYGVFPLKGKLLNVREASNKQIINNQEFINLKKILGLNIGKVYTKDNINELRYGSIILMMDADVDGSHIKGLFYNLLDYYWPSLLKLDNFVKIMITPVVKVSKNKETKSFFSLTKYENWKNSVKDYNKWKIKYYKGLGTSSSSEAKEYFKDLEKHTITYKWGNKSDKAIILAFSKKQADNRKLWLANYDRNNIIDIESTNLTIHDFIHKELIHFSNEDNIRSLPNMLDGLKPSQRKVLFTLLNSNNNEIKVSQLSGSVSLKTSYHHGENSLVNTIISMAQNFIGSNNVNLLEPLGQFGSRLMGGKDSASARYIFTKLNNIANNIFNKDDDFQLNFLDDDGIKIEPEYYLPIIPIILINGSEGIGTGYSTSIPKFKLQDIKNSLINKLQNDKFLKLDPGYENFKGEIKKIDNISYYSIGCHKLEKNILTITELPIGVWTEDYKLFLDKLIDKNIIRSIKNNCSEKEILFSIKLHDHVLENLNIIETFKLRKKILLSNMTCFNSKGKIKKYKSVLDILNEFYIIRLEAYEKRRLYLIKQLQKQININESKYKFINLIITNKLKLHKIDDNKIDQTLKSLKLFNNDGYDYLLNISFRQMTKNNLLNLQNKIKKIKSELSKIKKMTNKELWLDNLHSIKIEK